MKKFLPYILILVMTVGFFSPTSTLYSQNGGLPGVAPQDPLASLNFPTNNNTIKPTSVSTETCGIFGSWVACFEDLLAAFMIGILTLMSFVVYLSGQLLNYVIQFTVVDMAEKLETLTGINIAWKVIRDLMNIAFIFLLVYEGIKLIIGQGSVTNVKKFITGIVLASLLINFSLFFTKVLIDASNIVTIGFYKSILGPEGAKAGYGLSNPIVGALGLTSIYKAEGEADFGKGKGFGGILVMGIGSAGVIIVSSFVFFAIAILFIIRYVTLILLLMLSPVAYMGLALPFMKKYASQWWDSLQGQLLFAPIYMIMTWVVLTLMTSNGFITNNSFKEIFDTTVKKDFDSFGLLLNFAVIIGLLIASLVIAKSTASQGSKLIGQATGKLSAFAGGAIIGSGARLGRNTVGRWGNATANNEDLKDRATKGGVGGSIARMQLAAGSKAAGSTFDARSTKTFGSIAGAAGMKNDFGKVDPKKDNYRAIREEEEKNAAKKAEVYKPSGAANDKAKADDAIANSQLDKALNDAQKELSQAKTTQEVARKDIQARENKIAKMQQDAEKSRIPKMKAKILEDIAAEEKELTTGRKNLSDLEKVLQDRNQVYSQAKNQKDNYKSKESELKIKYQDRVNDMASRIAHSGDNDTARGAIWRYTANTIGLATGIAGITAMPKTRTDREAIARKVRSVPQGKKKLTAKELKDVYGIETGDDENKKDDTKDSDKQAEEKPASTEETTKE